MTQIKHDTREHQNWKAELVETSRKMLERRTADIVARQRESMTKPDDDDDFDDWSHPDDSLDFG